jgi:hypothetical protein
MTRAFFLLAAIFTLSATAYAEPMNCFINEIVSESGDQTPGKVRQIDGFRADSRRGFSKTYLDERFAGGKIQAIARGNGGEFRLTLQKVDFQSPDGEWVISDKFMTAAPEGLMTFTKGLGQLRVWATFDGVAIDLNCARVR